MRSFLDLVGADIRHIPDRRSKDEPGEVRRRYTDEPISDVAFDSDDWHAYLALCSPDERADWIEALGWA